jgi:O-antigen/teichoic acid export membrane protein
MNVCLKDTARSEKNKISEISRTSKVLALSFGQIISSFASIISGIVAARLLSKHDYATMRQTLLSYNFIAPLLMLGLPNALYYFLPREEKRKRGIIIDNLILLVLLALIFSLFLLLGGYKLLAIRFNNQDLLTTLKWMIPYPLYVMPASVLGAVLLTQNKTFMLAKYNIFSTVLMTILSIIVVMLQFSKWENN